LPEDTTRLDDEKVLGTRVRSFSPDITASLWLGFSPRETGSALFRNAQ